MHAPQPHLAALASLRPRPVPLPSPRSVPVVLLLLAWLFFELKPSGKNAPPVWSGGWPLVGHFDEFAKNPLGAVRKGYEAKGPVFTMRFLNYNLTFLVGKEAHTPFFNGKDEHLDQNEPYKFMTPVFGKGVVFDAPAETRHQQLNFITHAFKGDVMRSYVAKIIDETEKFFAENWGESGQRDLLEDLSSLTLLTASRCLLGPEIRNTLFKEFSELFKKIDEGINPIAIFFPNAPLKAFRCVSSPLHSPLPLPPSATPRACGHARKHDADAVGSDDAVISVNPLSCILAGAADVDANHSL
jgi:sterol 14-demethylase